MSHFVLQKQFALIVPLKGAANFTDSIFVEHTVVSRESTVSTDMQTLT